MVPQSHVIPGTGSVLGDLLLWDSDLVQSAAFGDVLTLNDGILASFCIQGWAGSGFLGRVSHFLSGHLYRLRD